MKFVRLWPSLILAPTLFACGTEASPDDAGPGGAPGSGGSLGAATGGSSSGAGPSGGSTSSGGAGSGGSPALVDPCAEIQDWTCVPVEASGSYGSKTFDVPAQQNWVNTGLYLEEGQTATVSVTGSWSVTGSGGGIDHGTCKVGDLVARIGLHYKDAALTCVTGSGAVTVTADKDGILFVGALAGNDLGETYETRHDDSGSRVVTVASSQGSPSPSVGSGLAADFAWNEVLAGSVEVWGEHVILTLPTSVAEADAATLAAAVAKLDLIYEYEEELRGAKPQQGQRIRFFPDGTQPGYMLAGNPVRMDLDLVEGDDTTRISRSGEAGTSLWGFAHELGHDFSFAPNGFWTYQENTLESWCNLFSLYAFEKLGLPEHESSATCNASTTGSYDGGSWDAWEGLCFLRQFQFDYGWGFYQDYFQSIVDTTSTGGNAWKFVHDRLESTSGQNVTPTFDAWGVPH